MNVTSPVSLRELVEARRISRAQWSVGNGILYRLCLREHPGHGNPRAVVAKVWLIGRSYAAAVERSMTKAHSRETVDEKYMRVAAALKRCGLDTQLRRLGGRKPRVISDLAEALAIHECVLSALGPMTRTCPRSFASKYLHFHAPAWFFIYDSVASKALSKLSHGRLSSDLPAVGDATYRLFAGRAWQLREELAKRSRRLSTRELDCLLLARGA